MPKYKKNLSLFIVESLIAIMKRHTGRSDRLHATFSHDHTHQSQYFFESKFLMQSR